MTEKQKAAITVFKVRVVTANEVRKEFGLDPSPEPGTDMLITPYGLADSYSYISLDGKTMVNISKLFPTEILRLIAV